MDCVRAIPVPSQGTLSTAQLKIAETIPLPSPDIPSVTADAEQAPRRINPSCFLASPQPLQKFRSSHHHRMTIATILFVVSTAATLSSLTALPCLHVPMPATAAGVSTLAGDRTGRVCRSHHRPPGVHNIPPDTAQFRENAVNSNVFTVSERSLKFGHRQPASSPHPVRCQTHFFCTIRKTSVQARIRLPRANLFSAAIRTRPLSAGELPQENCPARPHPRNAATDAAKSRTPPSSPRTARPSPPSSACGE